MDVEFDMSEVDALATELAQSGPKAEIVSSAAMTKIAAKVRSDAKAAAPVDSGTLRDSIQIQGGRGYRIIRATAPYAFYVEFGTSDTAPQPFMWPQVPAASRALAEAMGHIGPFDPLPGF